MLEEPINSKLALIVQYKLEIFVVLRKFDKTLRARHLESAHRQPIGYLRQYEMGQVYDNKL